MGTESTSNATIRTVAAEAGVSISTVSRYLNHPEVVIQETRDRIQEAICKTGYVQNLAASGLKSRNSKIQLLFVPDICNPFYSKMTKRLQQLCSENGTILMTFDTCESVDREIEAISIARQVNASGVFAASVYADEKVIELLADLNIPVVGINSYPASVPFYSVGVHHLGGTSLAVKHLIQLGHTDIAFAGGKPGSVIGESRKYGYKYAMEEAGLPIRPEMICEEGFSEKDGYQAGLRLINAGKMPTAICCANDLVAFGVIRALREMGLSVPGAVSVTGMDDTPFASIADPRLTSVTNDGELFAEKAFQMMKIGASGNNKPLFVEVPNELIVRDSTAAPRTMRGR